MSVANPIIHLCIPQLLQPLDLWQRDFRFEPKAPHFAQLLRQFKQSNNHKIQGLDASLFNALGMAENPAAHYRYQAHTDTEPKQTLLCADPVHLEVGMKDITLTQTINDLSDNEADEIISELNKHFKQDGLAFIKGSNRHWYVALPQKEILETIPLDEVLRKNIATFLPRSSDKSAVNDQTQNWQIIQNESQMILHSCAVNQQREMAGLPSINSLWFWGGDTSKQGHDHSVSCVYYNESSDAEIKAKMTATAASCRHQKMEDIHQIIENTQGTSLVILDQLFLPAVYEDLNAYQQQLSLLDEEVIKPLVAAWQKDKIKLHIDGCDGRIIKPSKPSSWKFWSNKPRSLTEIACQ